MVRNSFTYSRPQSASLRRSAAVGLGLLVVSLAGPAAAAKIYRCGNVFQDQPCPEVKIVPTAAARASASDPGCTATLRDANGRGDCAARNPREAQRVVSADAKR